MIETVITFIEHTLVPYGALGVFVGSVIEEIVAPVPSTLVLLASGFLFLQASSFSLDYVSTLLFTVAFPAAAGMTIGSLVIYGIGYVSGKPALDRFGKYFGVSWTDVSAAQERFSGTVQDEITLVVLRSFPLVPNTVLNALCGLIRMPLPKYVLLSFVGFFIRALVLGFLGGQVGDVYDHYSGLFDSIEKYVLVGIIVVSVLVVLGLVVRNHLRKSSQGA